MKRIQKLSPQLVNKIAAGEVVERPASVVKELVENALDAEAERVEVTIEGGGARLIQVVDDGAGIDRDDLRLAVTSHATSKIRTADDLFQIGSLGFRGEALASIAAVSHLRLASRPRLDTSRGAELRVDGGVARPVRAAGLPTGTRVEVNDLFFNVPARRAFLRTEKGELRAALSEIKKQALARPSVHFRVVSDGKTVVEAPSAQEPRERIAQLLGRELAEDLLALTPTESGGVRLRGYASPCDRSRGDTQQQFFFLNDRAVRDVTLLSAVRTAYANLLPPRRHPIVLLWLDLDPSEVDVNVHPQKATVRFQHDRDVFRLVVHALRETLRGSGLVGELRLPRHAADLSPHVGFGAQATLPGPEAAPLSAGDTQVSFLAGETPPFLQVHRRYVIEQTEQGIRVVDPHALHERILYEEILERLGNEPLESQRFLFPHVVEVGPDELAEAETRDAELRALGFETSPFGQNALAIHAAPRLLKAERVPDAIRALLQQPAERSSEEEESGLLHDLAASLACRSAVRFGEVLSSAQISELLQRRAQVRRGHCCPHGRPVALGLTLDELDRRFGRQALQVR